MAAGKMSIHELYVARMTQDDKKAVPQKEQNTGIHLLCRNDIGGERRQKFPRVIRRDGGTIQIDQLLIGDVPQLIFEPNAVLLKQDVAHINQNLAQNLENGKNGGYAEK